MKYFHSKLENNTKPQSELSSKSGCVLHRALSRSYEAARFWVTSSSAFRQNQDLPFSLSQASPNASTARRTSTDEPPLPRHRTAQPAPKLPVARPRAGKLEWGPKESDCVWSESHEGKFRTRKEENYSWKTVKCQLGLL